MTERVPEIKLNDIEQSSLYLKDIKNFLGLRRVADNVTARKRDEYLIN